MSSLRERDTPVTIGIDLAAEPAGTAVVRIEWSGSRPRASILPGSLSNAELLGFIGEPDVVKVGIDCPFGWPEGFIDAISAHAHGHRWPGGDGLAARRVMRLRLTDRNIAERFREPLSVSSTYIGATAMRCAALLDAWAQGHLDHDRVGTGRIVEVYPAVAMQYWGLEVAGYKNSDNWVEARLELLAMLDRELDIDEVRGPALQSKQYGDDPIDALIAGLVAAGAATPGGVEPPPEAGTDERRVAEAEGWIAVPRVPISRLAPRAVPS